METYTDYKPFVPNPHFKAERQTALDNLDLNLVDSPLKNLVKRINKLPFIFTLQCCHGHFLNKDGEEIAILDFSESNELVEYRLAYIAFCIDNNFSGRNIRQSLINIPSSIDPNDLQFCSAEWFWDQWLNTYALQVMPERLKDRDKARLEHAEARKIGKVRDTFFVYLEDFIARLH